MNLLDQFSTANQGKAITLTISAGKSQSQQKNSYPAILSSLTVAADGSIKIVLQGQHTDNLEAPPTTISIPKYATIKQENNTLVFTYTTQSKEEITIHLVGVPISTRLPVVEEKPFVRDVKNAEGRTTKIVVSIPQTYPDKLYFEQAAILLHSILSDWVYISLAVRKATDMTWLHRNIMYNQITPVFLPGDSFFQILAYDKKEQVTIDIATILTIAIDRAIITYEFDGVSYELIRGDKG